RDARAVEESPVRAALVRDPPRPVVLLDDGVPRRGRIVVHDHVVPGVASDGAERTQRQALAQARSLRMRSQYDEVRESWPCRELRLGPERADQRRERADEEEVKDEKERDPDAPQGDLVRDLH